ncbi:hypothetical protein HY572_06700 [Candidatus Micrarchaeota archaeon]|nr:hypothetical protein [Candidatus Micrarchaeota archaeon]
MNESIILTGLLVALVTTWALTPLVIKAATRRGFLEHDDNKKKRPLVPGMGGFAILAGMMAGILVGILYGAYAEPDPLLQRTLLAGLSTVAMVAIVGALDDLFKIRLWFKTLLPVLGSLPLVATKAGQSVMNLPLLGTVSLGPLYNFVLVPLGVTGAANAANLTAGYNGLEAGFGVVAFSTLLIIAVQSGAFPAAVLLAAGLGACIGFLKYNWFPARIFPGDVGTLSIGALLASAAIVGNMEKYAVILVLPVLYELTATVYYSLKGVSRRKAVHSPVIAMDGTLSPPRGSKYYNLPHFILSRKPLREPHLVRVYLSLFAASGLLALATFWLGI